MTTLIEFRKATLGYGRKVVLRDISFTILDGDYFGLVGPNGAGKTTILRAILGGLKPLNGEVVLHPGNNRPLTFGYVPQRDSIDEILPYTVEEVVAMGRYRGIGLLRRVSAADRQAVARALEHVAIGNLRDRPFKDLSGGQKQRALIARALASDPQILILDEPTNGMDLSSRISILDLIKQLHDDDALTIIMVSHLLDDVANHVQRIALVEPGVFLVGDVDKVLTGANLSAMYHLPVRVDHLHGSTVILTGGGHGHH
jgi:ABC-type Mn2+/Zn2+ transport system ATPase subunit